MYSQNDLDEAVASGALSAESATALRAFVERQRALPSVDEEHFRLITGFNDIFVSIAAAILLFAVGWIGQSIGRVDGPRRSTAMAPARFAPLAVAATAWGLALFFTAKRRMALPSILLLLAFVGGAVRGFGLRAGAGDRRGQSEPQCRCSAGFSPPSPQPSPPLARGCTGAVSRCRSRSPPALPRSPAIAVALLVSLIGTPIDEMRDIILGFVLLLGVGMFLFAMRWDSSDPRADHAAQRCRLLAAPAGRADDRPSGLHPARPQRRQCQRSPKGWWSSLLYIALGIDRAGDRSPRLAGLGVGLCAVRAAGPVPASSARSSSTSR